MSAGAVFKLIANDGKADRMIMATQLLNQRINDVMCARTRLGKSDNTPTLVDLERTHILYVNAHFKPFAAIGYEYNKVQPNNGTAQFGGSVQFNIPQFGDFFHDMVCRTRLTGFSSDAGNTPTQGATDALFPFNGTVTDTYYNIVDSNRTVLVAGHASVAATPVSYKNYVRYCEYPGNRLFNLVKFNVNGNPLDQYDAMIPTMLEKFCTPPGKRAGHDRLVGQEVAHQGYSGIHFATASDANTANTPTGIGKHVEGQSNQSVALFGRNLAVVGAAAAGSTVLNSAIGTLNDVAATFGQVDVSRTLLQVVNGPQTPKPAQPPLEIWNKLRFWFNDDVRLSIASVSLPFGNRIIDIALCTSAELVYEQPSIFLETIFDDSNVRTKTYTPIFNIHGISTPPTFSKMELYINNLFVNPEVHDIYIKRIGFSLIRVYRQQNQRVSDSGNALLSALKWPIEYMFVGIRPAWNIQAATTASGVVTGNQNQWRDWHRLTRVVDASWQEADATEAAGGGLVSTTTSSIDQVTPSQYYLPVPTVDTMSLKSHGIVIFDGFNDTFFNQYLPFHYGGQALTTPDDVGALFVNMSLFPRSYQPSGHLNVSRARETYLLWTSQYLSTSTAGDLLAVAVAINFLLITDGSAVLRYST